MNTAECLYNVEAAGQDYVLELDGRRLALLGRGGPETELRPVREFLKDPSGLPVVIGAGAGHGLRQLLAGYQGPVAVVDREEPLWRLTGLRGSLAGRDVDAVTWIDAADSQDAVRALSRFQNAHGDRPLVPIVHPAYLRFWRGHYGPVVEAAKASRRIDFWAKARYPKFATWPPRVLLVSSRYFLVAELQSALEHLGAPCHYLDLGSEELGSTEFIQRLLAQVVDFRPDCLLTVNHLGVDREGVLTDLLARLELPLASWFVDNPHLILASYQGLRSPWATIFTWDRDNLPSLKAQGYPHVFYLPLGTDPRRFRPGLECRPKWRAQVSFVGNSMRSKVARQLKKCHPPRELLLQYRQLAAAFGQEEGRSALQMLASRFPKAHRAFQRLGGTDARLSFETLLNWEATRQYRQACVERILPFEPLIVGDRHWPHALRDWRGPWSYHPPVNYYEHLPEFYQGSAVNFNATSKQMKGAVNQRVFDVPACGAFLLGDHRAQLDELFEPGREAVTYREVEEIPELLRFYLNNPKARRAVAAAARRRVLAEHSYDQRLTTLLETMRTIYG